MSDETMTLVKTAFVATSIVALIVGYMVWETKKAKTIIRNWAASQGFHIVSVSKEFCLGPLSPFGFWKTSRSQVVFSLTVLDPNKQERSGWVKCGSFWGGVFFGDEIEVKWK